MKCEFSKKDLENMLVVFFQKRGAILNEVSLKEVVCDGEVSLKCKMSIKQKICGVEKFLEKELQFDEIKSIIDVIFEENLDDNSEILNIEYNLGFVPKTNYGESSRETYFNGVSVEIQTALDKVVDLVNRSSQKKSRGK